MLQTQAGIYLNTVARGAISYADIGRMSIAEQDAYLYAFGPPPEDS